MIGCLPRVLEVPRVVDDTEVPRILWVKCATSAECKTIRIAVSTVKDSWVTALGLRPHFTNCMCVDKTTWVKSRDLTWLSWVGAHSIYVDICNLSSWLLEFSWCMSYKLLNMSLHSKLAFCKNLPISCIVVSWTKTWVACEYIQSTHWLATGYLIDQAWKNRSSKKSSLETNMRTRTFPSQNACRVKADGMGSTYRRRFPLLVFHLMFSP